MTVVKDTLTEQKANAAADKNKDKKQSKQVSGGLWGCGRGPKPSLIFFGAGRRYLGVALHWFSGQPSSAKTNLSWPLENRGGLFEALHLSKDGLRKSRHSIDALITEVISP